MYIKPHILNTPIQAIFLGYIAILHNDHPKDAVFLH